MENTTKTGNMAELESSIQLLTIIGEIEGHEALPERSKTTKYEHILPRLAMVEDNDRIEGMLVLLNTVGGDVEAGLAIAEMIASLGKTDRLLYWEGAIRSVCRWRFLRIIRLLYRARPW